MGCAGYGTMRIKDALREAASALLPVLAAALLLAAVLLQGGCNGMFFQPDSRLYFKPETFNLFHEEVGFTSADGTRLRGWFLPGQPPVRGTVIHFHGNAANISNHIFAVRWLPPAGYSVLMFDYRGYGASHGSSSRAGAIADGVAAIDYVRSRKDVDRSRLIVYGQSLGGALAVNALAEAGGAGVRALVVEGGFASYQEVVRLIMDDTWFLWPFQYPMAYGFFSDESSPNDALPRLAGVPLLVIHGEADRTVPFEAGRQLFEAFPGKDKTLWAVPRARHMGIFEQDGSPWRGKLLDYMDARMKLKTKLDRLPGSAPGSTYTRPAPGSTYRGGPLRVPPPVYRR